MGNLILTNPSEPPETLKAIVTAILEDEALLATTASAASVTAVSNSVAALQAAAAYALYTSAGAVAPSGYAVLKTGTSGAMTLVNPASDGILLIIVAADAHAYTLTCSAGKLNGGAVGTFGGAIGDSLILLSSGGVWLAALANGVTIA